MKKSGLRNLFEADDEPGDKSLLSYQQANYAQKGQTDKSSEKPGIQKSGSDPAQDHDGRSESLDRNSIGENMNQKQGDFVSSTEGDVWPPTGTAVGVSLSSSNESHSSNISTSFVVNSDLVSEHGNRSGSHHRSTTALSSSTSSTKEPHSASSHSSDSSMPAQLCCSAVVTAYMYGKAGELVALGSLGLAVTHEPARGRSLLVLYRSRKEQLCLTTLLPSKLPEVKANNYVMITCDSGRRFSVRPAAPEVLFELLLSVVRAARLAADQHSQTPVVVRASLNTEPLASVGNAVTSNDRVGFRLTRWAFDAKSNKPRKLLAEKETTGATQEYDFLQAMRVGERQLVAVNTDCGAEVWDVLILAVRPMPREINLGTDSTWAKPQNSTSNRNDPHQAQLSDPGTQRGDGNGVTTGADAGLEDEASEVVLQSADGTEGSAAISEKKPGMVENPQVISASSDKPTPHDEEGGDALRRSDVLSRVARLGRHMFPLPEPARKHQEPASSDKDGSDSRSAGSGTRQVSETGYGGHSASGRYALPPSLEETPSPGDSNQCASPTVHTHPSTTTEKRDPGTEEDNKLVLRLDRLEAKLDAVLSRLDQVQTDRTWSESRSSAGTRRHAETRDQAEDVAELPSASAAEACEAVPPHVGEPAAQTNETSSGSRRDGRVRGAEACDTAESDMADSLMSGIQRLIREHSRLRHQAREAEKLRLKAEQQLEQLSERCSEATSLQAETEMKLSEAQSRVSAAEERLTEAEARALEAERVQVEMKARAVELEAVGTEAGRRASEAEARLMEAHASLSEMERTVSEYRTRMTALETRLESNSGSAAPSTTVAPAAARRLLKTVYKQMCARMPDDGAYSAARVGELLQEVMRLTLEQLKDRDGGAP